MFTGEKISNSLYGQSEYWPLNFNDLPSGKLDDDGYTLDG